jgi:ATPase family AAA domain-containing protein 2
LNGSLSKSKGPSQGYHPPIPLFDNASKPYGHSRSSIQNLLNKHVPDLKMDIDNSYLEKLHEQLSQQTSGCSVEQLEQINTSLMDCVWQMRGEWDRTKVAFEVTEAFNKVLEDMQQIQRFGSISQNTRDQLTNAGVHF